MLAFRSPWRVYTLKYFKFFLNFLNFLIFFSRNGRFVTVFDLCGGWPVAVSCLAVCAILCLKPLACVVVLRHCACALWASVRVAPRSTTYGHGIGDATNAQNQVALRRLHFPEFLTTNLKFTKQPIFNIGSLVRAGVENHSRHMTASLP